LTEERIAEPGAATGTHAPKFEKEDFTSLASVLATAMVWAQPAGSKGTFAPLFPAAATTTTFRAQA